MARQIGAQKLEIRIRKYLSATFLMSEQWAQCLWCLQLNEEHLDMSDHMRKIVAQRRMENQAEVMKSIRLVLDRFPFDRKVVDMLCGILADCPVEMTEMVLAKAFEVVGQRGDKETLGSLFPVVLNFCLVHDHLEKGHEFAVQFVQWLNQVEKKTVMTNNFIEMKEATAKLIKALTKVDAFGLVKVTCEAFILVSQMTEEDQFKSLFLWHYIDACIKTKDFGAVHRIANLHRITPKNNSEFGCLFVTLYIWEQNVQEASDYIQNLVFQYGQNRDEELGKNIVKNLVFYFNACREADVDASISIQFLKSILYFMEENLIRDLEMQQIVFRFLLRLELQKWMAEPQDHNLNEFYKLYQRFSISECKKDLDEEEETYLAQFGWNVATAVQSDYLRYQLLTPTSNFLDRATIFRLHCRILQMASAISCLQLDKTFAKEIGETISDVIYDCDVILKTRTDDENLKEEKHRKQRIVFIYKLKLTFLLQGFLKNASVIIDEAIRDCCMDSKTMQILSIMMDESPSQTVTALRLTIKALKDAISKCFFANGNPQDALELFYRLFRRCLQRLEPDQIKPAFSDLVAYLKRTDLSSANWQNEYYIGNIVVFLWNAGILLEIIGRGEEGETLKRRAHILSQFIDKNLISFPNYSS